MKFIGSKITAANSEGYFLNKKSKLSKLLYSNLCVSFFVSKGTPLSLRVEPIYQSCHP